MDMLTNLFNQIVNFIFSILKYFGLNTDNVPDAIKPSEEDTTAAE